ncbi:MAG: hypothetical protein FD124_3477 [Alphaproteobacteria bacterium]|nr:MAG: hypothetical protein FD160_1038 [Caulobacteraceae bacterium]TPW02217.1 MAG: hypothetical protein FD124_3477 [Alphaproteobacteria bacterium]
MRTLLAAVIGMAALALSPTSAFAHHNMSHSIVVAPQTAPCAHHRAGPSALSAALQFASGQRGPVTLVRDRHQGGEADCMSYEGMGVITAVSAATATVRHAQIRSRGMPAMTMAFAVTEVQSLQGLAVGDKVCFSLKEGDGGAQTIDRIMKR